MPRLLLAATLAATAAACGGPVRAEVTLEEGPGRVEVALDGQPFTTYLFEGHAKPILYPVLGPGGVPMTRSWPVEADVPDEAHDHPHHESLWFTHGGVAGVDFWLHRPDKQGRRPRIVQTAMPTCEGGEVGRLVTENDWLAPDGRVVLRDVRRLTFGGSDPIRRLDYEITLTAGEKDVPFLDTKEGTMAIRVRTPLQLRDLKGSRGAAGNIRSSEGLTDHEAWGKRSRWIDYFGPVEGRTVGIAILDHPDNLNHPPRWHARDYGLFAANPFGEHHFGGTKKGGYLLPAGESLTLRYRFLFHEGDTEAAGIADAWKAWTE